MYGDFRGFLEVYCHSPEAWGQGLMETKRTGIFGGLSQKTGNLGTGIQLTKGSGILWGRRQLTFWEIWGGKSLKSLKFWCRDGEHNIRDFPHSSSNSTSSLYFELSTHIETRGHFKSLSQFIDEKHCIKHDFIKGPAKLSAFKSKPKALTLFN